MESEIDNQAAQQLDKVDLHIIEAMQRDGREAFTQIAEQLDVSPGMIRQRYGRLVELGYLKVVAVTNPLMMGKRAMAIVGVRTDGRRLLEVAEALGKFEEVVYIVVVSGRYDILIEVFCRDHDDLLHFMTEKLARVDGVRETESYMHLKIIKEIYF